MTANRAVASYLDIDVQRIILLQFYHEMGVEIN